jgi:hypothetical protein
MQRIFSFLNLGSHDFLLTLFAYGLIGYKYNGL